MKVRRTTFKVDGINEPCIIVGSDDQTYVRISTCYHYLSDNTLWMTEYVDGDWNSSDEFRGNFKTLTDEEAIRLAKEFSAYIY